MIERLKTLKTGLRERFAKKHDAIEQDSLGWNEKIPLALALTAQSYVIFNWYLKTINGINPTTDFLVAIAAGVALDLIVVTTTMGRRQGRESNWSHATAFGAFVCSALIALSVYGAAPGIPEGWLHIAFPLEVWLYCQHLATPKKARALSQQPATLPTTESSQPVTLPIAAPAPIALPLPQPATKSSAAPSEPVAVAPATDSNPLPGWLMSEEVAPQEKPDGSKLPLSQRVAAILKNRPTIGNPELYALLPGESQSSIRKYVGDWRKEQLAKEQLATTSHNGNGRH